MAATLAAYREWAERQVGYRESPVNRTKYALLAGHANGYPWCATFLVAGAATVGLRLPSRSAYTPTMAAGFQLAGRWHTSAQLGDLAFYNFPDATSRIQHVGLVVGVGSNYVSAIEGNTSSADGGSQTDGGGVHLRVRPRSHVVGFGRPEYAPEVAVAPPIVGKNTTVTKAPGGFLVKIQQLDSSGHGWVAVPVPFDKLAGVVEYGPYPPSDGYWGHMPPLRLRTQQRNRTTIVVIDGKPFQPAIFHVRSK